MAKKVHLIGANTKNANGMEFFVSKAFKKLGYEVIETDYRVMSKEEVSTRIRYVTDAEFLLCIKGERIVPEDIFACRIPTVLWMQDSVQANQEANFIIQTKAPLFDIVYSFNKKELPFYRQFNKNAQYLPLAADADIHKYVNNPKSIDVGLIGNLNQNRVIMINTLLDKGIPIQYSYSQDNYPEIVSKTLINLNIGITDAGYQQRVFEILSMGGFLLSNKVMDENIFIDKEHLVYFENLDHCVDLCYYYNKHVEEAEKIAKKGQKEVLENHSYIHRVKQIAGDVKNGRN